jgi:type II secretory pathway component PulF
MLHRAVNTAVRSEIYNALASMLDNGVKLVEALEKLYDIHSEQGRKPSRSVALMLYEVKSKVEDGTPLHDALGPWVSSEEYALIQAGVESGSVEKTLRSAIKIVDVRRRIVGRLLTAVPYPIMLSVSTSAVLFVVGDKVVPSFERINPVENWEGSALAMYYLAWFVQNLGLLSVVLAIAFAVFVAWSLPRLRGSTRYTLDKLPPWSLYRRMNGGLFMLGVSVLIHSGIQLKRALAILSSNANPYLRERIEAVRYGVEGGLSFSKALLGADYDFPDRKTNQMLSAYDKLDSFEDALRRFAESEIADLETLVLRITDQMMMWAVAINILISILIAMGGNSVTNSLPNA